MADSKGASNKKVANSVVALSSAAVLAVYSAGYVRTKAAAERLEEAAAQRRPYLPMPAPTAAPEAPLAEQSAAAVTAAQVPAVEELRVGSAGPTAAAVDVPAVKAAPASPASVPVASGTVDAPAATANGNSQPAAAAGSEPVAVVARVEPAPAPSVPAPAALPSATLPLQQTERPASPVAPPVTPAPAAPVTSGWKDGKYLGWGYSRHGEIQAQVVIENGRIAYSVIAKCQTRWSCSLVEHLQKQVAQRQGPDVDYVAGATDSANAFYGAIVEALKQAR